MRLAETIHGTGLNITGNNWFTSIPLTKTLPIKNLTYVGTVRKNKTEIPHDFIVSWSPKSSLFRLQDQAILVSYIRRRNKNVLMLSTMHLQDDSIDERTASDKNPNIITFYNLTEGGVDIVDELCSGYSI